MHIKLHKLSRIRDKKPKKIYEIWSPQKLTTIPYGIINSYTTIRTNIPYT